MVIAVVSSGADVDARDRVKGYTPLHLTLIHQYKHLAEYLIQIGAETSLEDFSGETAEALAVRIRCSDLLQQTQPTTAEVRIES